MSNPRANAPPQTTSLWLHRLAWTLACATFALLYVGGAVTTYSAGMAVPDWPTTEGDWLYPLGKWPAADWDVFLEHGHRMLGAGVGVITIALAVALWTLDRRKWMRWVAATCVTNCGWPLRFKDHVWAIDYTVVAEASLQAVTTTAHAAVGALGLVAPLGLALWSRRLLRGVSRWKGRS